jgi:hypothetical protein
LYGFNLFMLTSIGFGSNLPIVTSKIILLGKQCWILCGPNHHLKIFGACLEKTLGNHNT